MAVVAMATLTTGGGGWGDDDGGGSGRADVAGASGGVNDYWGKGV